MHRSPATKAAARALVEAALRALETLWRARTKHPAWMTDEVLFALAEARSYVRKLLHLLRPNHA